MKNAQDFSSKQARADYIDRRLAELYPETPVPLDHRDPYTLLVAVIPITVIPLGVMSALSPVGCARV